MSMWEYADTSEISNEVLGNEVNETPEFFHEIKESQEQDLDLPVHKVNDNDCEGNIYLITRNESLEGDVHPITGVPFKRMTIETSDGEKLEGVFPEFQSEFDAKVPEEIYTDTDYKQFKECNKQLLEGIEKDPELKGKFTHDQLEQIKDGVNDGTAPDGYVWHHDAEPGVIRLVDYETHATTGHTGGRAVWGGGNENR